MRSMTLSARRQGDDENRGDDERRRRALLAVAGEDASKVGRGMEPAPKETDVERSRRFLLVMMKVHQEVR